MSRKTAKGTWGRKKNHKPAIAPTYCPETHELKQFSYTPAELRAKSEELGIKAIKIGEEVKTILASYGSDVPREWQQKELRGLIETLRRQCDFWDALAVEKYADARVEWAKAIGVVQRAGKAPSLQFAGKTVHVQTAMTSRPPGKQLPKVMDRKSKATTPKDDFRPTCSEKWVGRVEPMPPTEPWHATTPPWEDKPVSQADTQPIRIQRRSPS